MCITSLSLLHSFVLFYFTCMCVYASKTSLLNANVQIFFSFVSLFCLMFVVSDCYRRRKWNLLLLLSLVYQCLIDSTQQQQHTSRTLLNSSSSIFVPVWVDFFFASHFFAASFFFFSSVVVVFFLLLPSDKEKKKEVNYEIIEHLSFLPIDNYLCFVSGDKLKIQSNHRID